ncbi:MAG: hypothetical protein JXA21_26355 [Anaerolineae bacterium]|nr:hypothetical protein [Anaerolineae bacterium]
MTKWIGEWIGLSMLAFFGVGGLFVFWIAWPNLLQSLSAVAVIPDMEGLAVIAFFAIVVIGFLKLVFGRS